MLQIPISMMINWWPTDDQLLNDGSIEWMMIRDRIRTTNNMLGDCYAAAVVEQLSRKELMALDAASILVYQVCCAYVPLSVLFFRKSINSCRFKWKIGKFVILLILFMLFMLFMLLKKMEWCLLLLLATGFAH